jgi:hypothetical protein
MSMYLSYYYVCLMDGHKDMLRNESKYNTSIKFLCI